MTYTYALLEVSPAAYEEIREKLLKAGYEHAFHDDRDADGVVIDMHGLALKRQTTVAPDADHSNAWTRRCPHCQATCSTYTAGTQRAHAGAECCGRCQRIFPPDIEGWLPCKCGCGKLTLGGHPEGAHPEDYRWDERA